MKPSVLHNECTVLVKHSDIVLARVDTVATICGSDSVLATAFKSRDGKGVTEFLVELAKAPKGEVIKPSGRVKKFLEEHETRIATVIRTIDYVATWAKKAHEVIFGMINSSQEFDVRWNNTFTINFCKLYTTFNKVAYFIFCFPLVKFCIYSAPLIKGIKESDLTHTFKSIRRFVNSCSKRPDMALLDGEEKENKAGLVLQLTQLLSQVGPTLVETLGQWPLVNWQNFNPFQRGKSTGFGSESTYADLEHIIITYIGILKDTFFYYCISFSDYIQKHPQFTSIMISILSESASVYLTKKTFIPLKTFIETIDPEKKAFPQVVRSLIARSLRTKLAVTHGKRVCVLARLVRDMVDVATYNANYLGLFLNDLISLSAFAAYELDVQLAPDHFKELQSKPEISSAHIELLDALVSAAKIFSKYEVPLKRTFLFNLATVDVSFLNTLLTTFSVKGAEWQYLFIDQIREISEALASLDIETVDSGGDYDFLGLLTTAGRLVFYFNALKKGHAASHLQPLLEQLETIRLHALFCDSPVEAFLSFCPIQSLWRHLETLHQITEEGVGGEQYIGSIVSLFAFFNLDTFALSQMPADVKRIKDEFQKIRASTLKNIYIHLGKYIGKGTYIHNVINQNRFDQLFDPTPYIRLGSAMSTQDYERELEFKKPIFQMRSMMARMPGAFEFGGQQFSCAAYLGDNIKNCIATVLFSEPVPDPMWIDSSFSAACQIMWPLFTLVGASFTQKMLQCRFEHASESETADFLQQVALMRQSADSAPAPVTAVPGVPVGAVGGGAKLVKIFAEFVRKFVRSNCFNAIYLPHSKSFVAGADDNTNYEFFSYRSFVTLVTNLGPQATFSLDRTLISERATIMHSIFKTYQTQMQTISAWYNDYKVGGSDWRKIAKVPEFATAAKDMIRLGVASVCRELLRKATFDVAQDLVPGALELINSGTNRVSGQLPEKEALLREVIGGQPTGHFTKTMLGRQTITKSTDTQEFFFFMSILLATPVFQQIEYFPETEYISGNAHLFPAGVNAFIESLSFFCEPSDAKAISSGMVLFFTIARSVINQMVAAPNVSKKTTASFTILVDMFPRFIPSLEYGRISTHFPPSVVSQAYNTMSVDMESKKPARKGKKGKKGKKK